MTQPRLLVISALDPSAGAGMLMDTLAARAAGAQVVSAVTAITVQGPSGIRSVHPVESSLLTSQIETLLDELPVGAIKIGALGTEKNVQAVARILRKIPEIPVVVDPVIKPTRGVQLLPTQAVTSLARKLLPVATLITPNLAEAGMLTEMEITDEASMVEVGISLVASMGRGERWALVKGGHLEGRPVDVLVGRNDVRRYRSRRRTGDFRGTGCALASAIAAKLSLGATVPEAVKSARRMLTRWMDKAPHPPRGPRCLKP